MATTQTYEEIIEKFPHFKDVISESSWKHIGGSDEKTLNVLKKQWIENMRKNVSRKLLKRHGGMNRDLIEFGRNKAIVAIGAGPSLNNNIDDLKRLHDTDGLRHPNDRDFIFIASNHMFKPLLRQGIIPDFVFLIDASDVVLDQLTKDIPESGKHVTLLAGLQCSPKVLKRWHKQGREIRFYVTATQGLPEEYNKLTGKDPKDIYIIQGGNVLNAMWASGLKFFKSTVFMALGNDLSYPFEKDIESRREGYYADGDYSSNTGTGRDEAYSTLGWMGFELKPSSILSANAEERYNIGLYPVSTTGTLWVYKTWIEAQVLANCKDTQYKYMYYNCSEGGIAGVMHKEGKPYDDINSWYLLDSVCPRWKTIKFSDAIVEFLKAKEFMRWGGTSVVQPATALAQ